MSIPVCIQNNILVELDKAFQDEIVSDGGMRFYQDTSFRPEWNVTTKGTVVSVPKKLTAGGGASTLDPDRARIIPNVKAGDEIIFSYLVVMRRKQFDNKHEVFTKQRTRDPYITVWADYTGKELVRIYLTNDKYDVGLFERTSKTWLDRLDKCSEKQAEAFIEKYMPSENVGFHYANVLPFGDKDYWMVDYANAIAIQKPDGTFEMVGEYALLEPIREPRREKYQGKLEIYNLEQDTDYRAVGRLISIGEPLKDAVKLSVKPNEQVITDIRYVEKYCIDNKDYWVVRQKYLFGKYTQNDHSRHT